MLPYQKRKLFICAAREWISLAAGKRLGELQ